jgi:guanylate kinase
MVQRNYNGRNRIILVGPACSGKDYLKSKLIDMGLKCPVMYTTRPPRTGEVNGVDYHFIDQEDFKKRTEQGHWVIEQEFNGWFYGHSKEDFHSSTVLLMTPSGIELLDDDTRRDSLVVYLDIPENIRKERLAKRICADDMNRRLNSDREDFKDFIDYDIVLSDTETFIVFLETLLHIRNNSLSL